MDDDHKHLRGGIPTFVGRYMRVLGVLHLVMLNYFDVSQTEGGR